MKGNDLDMKQLKASIMEDLRVEYVVECSAKLQVNVQDLFYFSQKAVLYSSIPLLDKNKQVCAYASKKKEPVILILHFSDVIGSWREIYQMSSPYIPSLR